jgi:hypothetical protein
VETEDPQTEPGEGNVPASNVVRLPRDWLGPKDGLEPGEELVPVGSPAPEPPGADAFWSESSAAIQDAWQAPGWEAAWGQDGTEDAEPERPAGRPRRARRSARWRRPRTPALLRRIALPERARLAAGAFVLVGLAGLIGAIESGPAGRQLATAQQPLTASGSPGARLPLTPHHVSQPGGSRPAQVTKIRRERGSSHAAPAAGRRRQADPRSAAAEQTVAVSQSVSSSPSASQRTSLAAPASAGSGESVGTSGGTSSTAPTSSAHAAGPAGPGAPFGPGHVG